MHLFALPLDFFIYLLWTDLIHLLIVLLICHLLTGRGLQNYLLHGLLIRDHPCIFVHGVHVRDPPFYIWDCLLLGFFTMIKVIRERGH
jgi:hypothetical protein